MKNVFHGIDQTRKIKTILVCLFYSVDSNAKPSSINNRTKFFANELKKQATVNIFNVRINEQTKERGKFHEEQQRDSGALFSSSSGYTDHSRTCQ